MSRLATPEGTTRYARRHADAAPGHFREALGLTLSSVGFGSYLGDTTDEADAAYAAAFVTGMRSGVNVLDTAANYRGGHSERAVGAALRGAGVPREELVLATKGGFLPGPPDPALVDPGELVMGCHVMTPRYLAHRFEESLAALGVEGVDVYFLHNPEAQLSGGLPRRAFEARLRDCFGMLEDKRREGKLGVYGLATWSGMRVGPTHPEHLPLERILSLAQEVGGESHGLRAIELPFNMGMPEAATKPTQPWRGEVVPVLEAAREAGLLVLASASLYQTRVLGRIEPKLREDLLAETDAEAALQFVRSTPGVTTALVGTGTPEHAEANARVRTLPVVADTMREILGL